MHVMPLQIMICSNHDFKKSQTVRYSKSKFVHIIICWNYQLIDKALSFTNSNLVQVIIGKSMISPSETNKCDTIMICSNLDFKISKTVWCSKSKFVHIMNFALLEFKSFLWILNSRLEFYSFQIIFEFCWESFCTNCMALKEEFLISICLFFSNFNRKLS